MVWVALTSDVVSGCPLFGAAAAPPCADDKGLIPVRRNLSALIQLFLIMQNKSSYPADHSQITTVALETTRGRTANKLTLYARSKLPACAVCKRRFHRSQHSSQVRA